MSEVTLVKQVIGITGGIASGKSNVCSVIKNEGYQIIDSDQISRDFSKKDYPIYNVQQIEQLPKFDLQQTLRHLQHKIFFGHFS